MNMLPWHRTVVSALPTPKKTTQAAQKAEGWLCLA